MTARAISLAMRVCAEVGYPNAIRVDQGPEFVSKALDLWAYAHLNLGSEYYWNRKSG